MSLPFRQSCNGYLLVMSLSGNGHVNPLACIGFGSEVGNSTRTCLFMTHTNVRTTFDWIHHGVPPRSSVMFGGLREGPTHNITIYG